jgi:hypothetical protein
MNAAELPKPGTYRHYKGGYYHLAWLARREHDGEWMCCYARTGTLERYVRPAAEWFEPINDAGTLRFTPAGTHAQDAAP